MSVSNLSCCQFINEEFVYLASTFLACCLLQLADKLTGSFRTNNKQLKCTSNLHVACLSTQHKCMFTSAAHFFTIYGSSQQFVVRVIGFKNPGLVVKFLSLVPRPPLFFVLQFAFCVMRGSMSRFGHLAVAR